MKQTRVKHMFKRLHQKPFHLFETKAKVNKGFILNVGTASGEAF